MNTPSHEKPTSRRDLLRLMAVALLGGTSWMLLRRRAPKLVWQLDPNKCTQCGRCQTHCVLSQSAVKCVHSYSMCGYCDLCGGYLRSDAKGRTTGAENQLCPTAAIRRKFIEPPYYEYTIDEDLCIACGKCVKGCGGFGNGSLYLQVRHNRCKNCNQCAIAQACPSKAFRRVPASDPYLLKTKSERRIS